MAAKLGSSSKSEGGNTGNKRKRASHISIFRLTSSLITGAIALHLNRWLGFLGGQVDTDSTKSKAAVTSAETDRVFRCVPCANGNHEHNIDTAAVRCAYKYDAQPCTAVDRLITT